MRWEFLLGNSVGVPGMTLTVLQVAYPFAPVGPDAVGGAEQVLSQIERGMGRYGHRTIVLACRGSMTTSPLLTYGQTYDEITDQTRHAAYAEYAEVIASAIRCHGVDLVHMHGIDFHHYLPPEGVAVLATLHLPPDWYPKSIFQQQRQRTWLHTVSLSQASACPPCADLLPPIENGVAVETLPLDLTRRSFALALGRICPEKNQHAALQAGTQAGLPVLLGGKVFPYEAHRRYWHEQVEPLLARGPHRFLGALGFRRKRRLLNAARCLISTSVAAETSSLVAMEAMACGTPVVALASGALVDIVEDGVTGFLVRDIPELVEALAKVGTLSPQAIRSTAKRRFSAGVMLGRYAELYGRLSRGAHADAA